LNNIAVDLLEHSSYRARIVDWWDRKNDQLDAGSQQNTAIEMCSIVAAAPLS